MFAFKAVQQKAEEFQINLWVAALDYRKAFDSIEHSALWDALASQNVPECYCSMLQSLYSGQQARIRTDRLSKIFDITRGTKQSDLLSAFVFNSVLEHIFRQVKHRWTQRRFGLQLGTTSMSRLTNLRFADDVLLFGRSAHQVSEML